jgi:hypothetical protein
VSARIQDGRSGTILAAKRAATRLLAACGVTSVYAVTLACVAFACTVMLPCGEAHAEPANGISLAAGYVMHTESPSLGSSGLGVQGDEQYVLRNGITLNPLVMFSDEEADGRTSPTVEPDGSIRKLPIRGTARHMAIAFQVRQYFGSTYIGAHVGLYYRYYEGLFAPSSFATEGGGIAAGWEGASGWIAGGQVDVTQFALFGAPYGVRVFAGYRWR